MIDGMVDRFFFQAEDGIRDLVRSRGLGDVYKRQGDISNAIQKHAERNGYSVVRDLVGHGVGRALHEDCLLYTSDAADERSSVDLGGRRIIKKKNPYIHDSRSLVYKQSQHHSW